MKIIAFCLLVVLCIAFNPFEVVRFDSWQLPLWIADLSWVGIELFGALVAVIVVIAVIALVSVGVLGAGLIVGVGVMLALLFGSLMIAWPLLLIVCLCWLVTDNHKVA
ncbi:MULTISPECIES: hypothetical protein [Pseudoalteromonas]|jgi:hypothetical protein|uniref:Uncharacterized protein n=1 Tax=Pseudoalteromonas prydzensis TaxID=182141 RepID=A0ABR9FPM5_9GAMM|nr:MULTISPECIES: hypothetical protein [Pseudoalteromonas]MBE0377760.1 hypothetical protein [Pseudoalteromonas prydzensis ACAM 620]MBE0458778.1 hypothetical protein [Pseudoalteromonas prydzensis]WKD22879.1 hypothetical protein NDQ71_14770 [Pseudoalteromonas sp. KG3]